jgi:dihydrofolate reductase
MRKVKLFIASSLDGYIARADGGIDWLFTDADYGYTPFYDSIDTVVMGRKTYDLALSFGEYPYKGKAAYVFSRSRSGTDEQATFVSGSAAAFVDRLRGEPGRDIWLVGGGELARDFADANVIDEYIISIHPRLIRTGLPLFWPSPQAGDVELELVSSQAFPSGLAQLTYRRAARGN